MLVFKKSEEEYFIRYEDLNKVNIVLLQLKIKIFFYEMHAYNNDDKIIYIENDDKEVL